MKPKVESSGTAMIGRWIAAFRRADVDAPRPSSKEWASAALERRPVDDELRRVYAIAAANFVAVTILLLPVLMMASLTSGGPRNTLDLNELARWVQGQRDVWKIEVLLGIPVTVIFPSVLTVVLSSSPTGTATRPPRAEAILEVVRNLLYYGLVLSAGLALIGTVPGTHKYDVPQALLALAISAGCLIMSGTLRAEGTQKDLLVAKAKARLLAVTRSKDTLQGSLQKNAHRSHTLLDPGRSSSAKVALLGVSLLGSAPAIGLGVGSLFLGQPSSWPKWLAGILLIWVYVGAQAMFIVHFCSRRRLATTPAEKASAFGFLVVPFAVVAIQVIVLTGLPLAPTAHAIMVAFTASLVLADLLAVFLNCSLFASVVDYRRLGSLQNLAAGQLAYLSDNSETLDT